MSSSSLPPSQSSRPAFPSSPASPAWRCYRVGGSVRDALLGLPAGDVDWVVVGARPEQLTEAGYRPVGRDFPVFLHPTTHEEYALARLERKTGPGYRGFQVEFDPGVTLEQDLERRDLTINAMAMDDDGRIIDPFNGRQDLQTKTLRHVGPAFVEDPVRILRLARFAARFDGFAPADETRALMVRMVDAGEVDALVPERIWQEISRGLMERRPSRMLQVLHECGAWRRIAPEYGDDAALPAEALDHAAALDLDLPVRYAVLASVLDQTRIESLCRRWRVPLACREAAFIWMQERAHLSELATESPEPTLGLLERLDAFRRPGRIAVLAQAARVLDASALQKHPPSDRNVLEWLELAVAAAARIDQGAIARRQAGNPAAIKSAVREARLAAIDSLRHAT